MLKFIVTGTGRCGTVYMAKALTSFGIPCGHESVFNYENEDVILKRLVGEKPTTISICAINNNYNIGGIEAESSYMCVPYLNHTLIKDIPIIHIVRNPLSVISSFVKDLQYFCNKNDNPYNIHGWEQWIYKQIPHLESIETPLERACYYYTKWNNEIEKCAKSRKYYFHRVEDVFEDGFFKFLNINKKNITLDTNINTMKKRNKDFSLGDIPDGKIKDDFIKIIKKYKYIDFIF